MMLSKMHFAKEMAMQGHQVYFVNPPRPERFKGFATVKEKNEHHLTIIQLKQIKARLFLRYKAYWLYKIVTNQYIKSIKKITGDIDEVWCFDPNSYCDLRKFNAPFSLLLLYDFYKGDNVFEIAKTAQGLVSVSQVILDYYDALDMPKLLVQHGLSKNFSEKAIAYLKTLKIRTGKKIKVGYVGNLFRQGVNTAVAKKIIASHPEIEFHFWGPASLNNSNLSTVYKETYEETEVLLNYLHASKNVFFHGMKTQEELSSAMFEMDAFLFLYSYRHDVNNASNAHKLMEYLSTGKAVIATHVSNYENTGLLVMSPKNDEEQLPDIFDRVINNLGEFNSIEKQQQRIAFALENTYTKQITRIKNLVEQQTL